MPRIFLSLAMVTILFLFSGCSMSFGQPDGPDSGDEIDLSQEPSGPDSGEDEDNQGPDSGDDEDNQGPDSGEEIDLSEPTSPDSGEDSDNQGPDSGEDGDNQGPDSGEEIDLSQEPSSPDSGEDSDNQGPDSGEDSDNQGPDSGEEITLNDDLKNRAKGSCNAIGFGSTCVEYIGSYWGQSNYAQLNCGNGGAFSKSPCPRPTVGGCRIGADTANEIVTWHYNYGGDPFTDEVVPYYIQSCNALAVSHWVN